MNNMAKLKDRLENVALAGGIISVHMQGNAKGDYLTTRFTAVVEKLLECEENEIYIESIHSYFELKNIVEVEYTEIEDSYRVLCENGVETYIDFV